MAFFKKLFFKKENPSSILESDTTKESTAQRVAALLQCPVKELSQPEELVDLEDIWDEYQNALRLGKQQGFTPILILCDDLMLETIEENLPNGKSHITIPAQMDGKAFLDKRYAEYVENLKTYGEDTEEILTEAQNTSEGINRFLSLRMILGGKDVPILLAEIPTKKPWEAMAWIPFGGWNDCPMPEECLAALKYWYETHGAVPACIGSDTLELYILEPVTDAKQAESLAKEQYAFCADIVDQGVGSIPTLAQELRCSTVWYFWWD